MFRSCLFSAFTRILWIFKFSLLLSLLRTLFTDCTSSSSSIIRARFAWTSMLRIFLSWCPKTQLTSILFRIFPRWLESSKSREGATGL